MYRPVVLTLSALLMPLSLYAQALPPDAVVAAPATLSSEASVPEVPIQVAALQDEWALIKYKTSDKAQQEKAINALVAKAQRTSAELNYAPEALAWQAIIVSTRAGIVGGTGALEDIRTAKELLEKVIANKPATLNGSAYTSLATLYFKAPSWPISFGDNKKAEANFRQALNLNPNGIDPNYFYGEFLYDQGKPAQAKTFLLKAQEAAPRPGREIADAGRRDEIRQLLAKIDAAK